MTTARNVDVQRTLENLEEAVHPDNIEAIRRFVDHQAAEGIGELQQQRQVQSLKAILTNFAPDGFRLEGASEAELKEILAGLNRSDYADASKHKFKGTIKKFYKVENGGHDHPAKVDFFKVTRKKATPVTRDDLFTDEELTQLFHSFASTRDRALAMTLYESAARPGELLSRSLADFTANAKGDFIYLEGLKGTPDRTNQLVRAGRTLREWIAQHPFGGEVGQLDDPQAPLWVKTEQQVCTHCGAIPRKHSDSCEYEPDRRDPLSYDSFLYAFKKACANAGIPESKQRPYNLRHTRLTEVATFMGYEQLNKFAGWAPGSSRAKVYVHLNNDDVNKAIRKEYGLDAGNTEDQAVDCSFCGTENQPGHSECRTCGRPLSLEEATKTQEKQRILERLAALEEKGVLEKLEQLEKSTND